MNHQIYVIIARNDVRDIIQYLIIAHAKEELGRTENSIIGKYNKIDGKRKSGMRAKQNHVSDAPFLIVSRDIVPPDYLNIILSLSLRKQNKNDYEKSENHRRKENRVQRPDGKVRKQD
jgi:hypothetical protein